jgi:glycosyltransferase involved in cell wall biosynthesis
MTAHPQIWTLDSPSWDRARPRLSVLIPYYRDDPGDLLAALDHQAKPLGDAVEMLVLDDGSGDDALARRTAETVSSMAAAARLLRLAANEGRAKGRNRLMAQARAERLLFLDADMLPDRPSFLADYLRLIEEHDPAVAFGGFTLERTPVDPERGLHPALYLPGE